MTNTNLKFLYISVSQGHPFTFNTKCFMSFQLVLYKLSLGPCLKVQSHKQKMFFAAFNRIILRRMSQFSFSLQNYIAKPQESIKTVSLATPGELKSGPPWRPHTDRPRSLSSAPYSSLSNSSVSFQPAPALTLSSAIVSARWGGIPPT